MGKGGGFKGMPGGMQGLMQQAQKMQADLQKAQEKAKKELVDAQSGGGMVKLKMNGEYEIIELTISPDVIDPNDPEMLQDLIKAAFSEASAAVQRNTKSAMEAVTGGISIPGMF